MKVRTLTAEALTQLILEMGLARQSVQRTTDLLAGDAVVESPDNPAHRRAKLVRLTSQSQEVLGEISQRQVAWTNGLTEALPLGERRVREALEVLRLLCMELERADPLLTDGVQAARGIDRSTFDRKE